MSRHKRLLINITVVVIENRLRYVTGHHSCYKRFCKRVQVPSCTVMCTRLQNY